MKREALEVDTRANIAETLRRCCGFMQVTAVILSSFHHHRHERRRCVYVVAAQRRLYLRSNRRRNTQKHVRTYVMCIRVGAVKCTVDSRFGLILASGCLCVYFFHICVAYCFVSYRNKQITCDARFVVLPDGAAVASRRSDVAQSGQPSACFYDAITTQQY